MKKRHTCNHVNWFWVCVLLFGIGVLCHTVAIAGDFEFSEENPAPIGPPESITADGIEPDEFTREFDPLAPQAANTIEGINFDENKDLTGFYQIPPDPIAVAGTNHLLSVVNSSIEWITKAGNQRVSMSLANFFSALTPENLVFDPKIIYDQYAERFVVVALVRVDNGILNPDNVSRILMAVSDDGNPNGIWYLDSIDSRLLVGGLVSSWADFPGLAIDEEAVYITANMFSFGNNTFTGSRLWILDKGVGSGGFYDDGVASITIHDPSTLAPLPAQAPTLQPAHVFGPDGIPGGAGTFLVNSGWTGGSIDFLSVIRVDDPLGAPSFSNQFINLGDITNGFNLPDAPQAGTGIAIETNDVRTLHAVWRDNTLWAVNTVNPPNGSDAGQATAHWYEIDTSVLSALTLTQQGDVGGEDIAPDTHTFFPSISVDEAGNMGLGFTASAPTIFPGAYYTGRQRSDPAGTVQSSETLAAGVDFYVRTLGSGRNRWGDYSGMSIDPSDERTFWVFNQYALTRGTVINGEDGRWGTRFGSFVFSLCEGDFDNEGDVDGSDLSELISGNKTLDLDVFAMEFGRNDCL